jgi:hypothetical protein
MNTASTLPLDPERRAWRYDLQDGLLEFVAGFLFLIVARAVVDPHLAWLPALLIFPLRFVMRIMKQRFTYPRIGYVKLRSEDGGKLGRGMLTYVAVMIAILAAGLWVFGDVSSFAQWKRWLPALAGVFTAGGFTYLAGKSGLARHWALVAVSAGWGLACVVWLRAPGYLGIQRWAVGLAMVCLIMGAVTFAGFVRRHPVRQEGDDAEVADVEA